MSEGNAIATAFIILPTGEQIIVTVQERSRDLNPLFTIGGQDIRWKDDALIRWAEGLTFRGERQVHIVACHRVTIQMLARALQACGCPVNAAMFGARSTMLDRARHRYLASFSSPENLATSVREFLPKDYRVTHTRPPDWKNP